MEANKWVEDICLTVPNLYTLLSSLPPEWTVCTVLDQKDTFFSLPLAPISQPLFAFEWHDRENASTGSSLGPASHKVSRTH